MSARTSNLFNYYQVEVGLFAERDNHERQPHLYDSLLVNTKKMKVADVPFPVPVRVLFLRAKDNEAAKKCARKIGTIFSCEKVDESDYYERREKLEQRALQYQNMPEVRVEIGGVTLDGNLNVIVKPDGANIRVDI